MKKKIAFFLIITFFSLTMNSQSISQKTYCNPVDIDYTYMSHYRARTDVSYRSGADPAVINFKGQYYMFVTRSHGYWSSNDLNNWKFIHPQNWYFRGSNAPAAAVRDGKVLVYGDPSGRGPIIEGYLGMEKGKTRLNQNHLEQCDKKMQEMLMFPGKLSKM